MNKKNWFARRGWYICYGFYTQQYVSNINYNEKGQRIAIYYGNNSKTKYEYNPLTFRLTRLLTTRNTGQDILQDLNYTYDPVGNITQQVDNAQQIHYFSNSVIEPKGMYKYDALYRLIEAKGRELTSLQLPTHDDFANNIPVPNTASNAMQNYTQQYSYDELGNINQMKSMGKWTRDYYYNFTANNYLLGHTENTTEYTYDQHGNMLTMPHLQALSWDYKDQLTKVDLNASGNKAYYIYDAGGNRTRKVIVKGNIVEERYYLGDYELYRKTNNGTVEVERSTVHISDDKKRIAQIDDDGTTEIIRYQYDNHLGSASLELDNNANIISYEEYHPFGTTSYRSGRSETETSLKRYKYVGKERDEETGLYYYGARYYAAWIARFVSVDPLQFKYPQFSPFQYSANCPITFNDLDGNETKLNEKLNVDIPINQKPVIKELTVVQDNVKAPINPKINFVSKDEADANNLKEFVSKMGFTSDVIESSFRQMNRNIVLSKDGTFYKKIGDTSLDISSKKILKDGDIVKIKAGRHAQINNDISISNKTIGYIGLGLDVTNALIGLSDFVSEVDPKIKKQNKELFYKDLAEIAIGLNPYTGVIYSFGSMLSKDPENQRILLKKYEQEMIEYKSKDLEEYENAKFHYNFYYKELYGTQEQESKQQFINQGN
ncbi:MAG: RHS repeat-associated core domain-containing protein [Salinivirgaceae bacterium]